MTPTTKPFGTTGQQVSSMGLGCMGMSGTYGRSADEDAIRTLHRSLEMGCTFLDTADVYGSGHNEQLLGRAIAGKRSQVFLATKFGLSGISNSPGLLTVNGRPEYAQAACEASLKRLQVDVIDLYYLHRLDKTVPIEETVGAMGRLVEQGKVRYLGLSEVSAATLERAHRAHPIAALQSEYSLWWTEPEAGALPACRKLGVAFVAYSPLGRGMLAGKIQSPTELDEKDWRRVGPRFQAGAFEHNLQLTQAVSRMAARKGVSPGQIALAWLLHEGPEVFPIPGTKRIAYLEENWQALNLTLTPEDRQELRDIMGAVEIQGHRYPERAAQLIDQG
ncbi:MAG: aldo/keto reductase [Deltaproteobacteria bacterium]|nr:aldo/keto reductase [Deltaproteobacteria bacterium]MDH4122051.1 aldo/keto reductase [Deltaproteobacteria bacterium]